MEQFLEASDDCDRQGELIFGSEPKGTANCRNGVYLCCFHVCRTVPDHEGVVLIKPAEMLCKNICFSESVNGF